MFSKILVCLVLVAIVYGKRLTPQDISLENFNVYTKECKDKFSDAKEQAACIKPYEVDYNRRVYIFDKRDKCLAECAKSPDRRCKALCSSQASQCFDDVPRVKDECVKDMKDPQ